MRGKLLGAALAVAAGVAWLAAATGGASADVVAASGTLTANGTGVAAVRGLLDMQVSAGSGSILLAKDIAGGATINVTGASGQAPFGNFTAYFGFQSATVTGTEVAVVAVGQGISLNASGHGWAYLKGTGTYSVDGGSTQPWRADGGFAGIGPVQSQGTGVLQAQGTGVAAVRGLLDVQVGAGSGSILLVRDIAGGATVNVTGASGQAPFGEFTAYFGFQSATVTGTGIAVIAVGQQINLTATGRGWAYLKGTGTYTVNGGPSQPWREIGGFAGIAPS
jgi:limonene-1,2-epoxide hydrolase